MWPDLNLKTVILSWNGRPSCAACVAAATATEIELSSSLETFTGDGLKTEDKGLGWAGGWRVFVYVRCAMRWVRFN